MGDVAHACNLSNYDIEAAVPREFRVNQGNVRRSYLNITGLKTKKKKRIKSKIIPRTK